MIPNTHLHDKLAHNPVRVTVETRFGPVIGGRADNGAAVFLEVPYALPPRRFEDPRPLPADYRYEDKEYIKVATYCAQPLNDGQGQGIPFVDKVGFGKPSENPLFCNIVVPPSFPENNLGPFPVKVYIHGGFLQFGSPHGLPFQGQYIAADRSIVRVNIGYRLSAFGFLACDSPHAKLNGNYGFKDQWIALEWIKANINSFGGDPNDIQIMGLSAGGHSVHQMLHHASHLPEGKNAPFTSAMLMSNAIVSAPKTPTELQVQYNALCNALELDPNMLSTLQDPSKVTAENICNVIETDAVGVENGTFRACVADDWLSASPDVMEWQRSGGFAQSLLSKGVKSIVVGDVTEEWYLYSIAHPIRSPKDIKPNLLRYYQEPLLDRILTRYKQLPEDAGEEESARLFGEILSDWQVHLPARVLARDLQRTGFPVLRYLIRWVPEQARPEGWVTHGSDATIWHYRLPVLEEEDVVIAKAWLDRVDDEVKALEKVGSSSLDVRKVLALKKDKTIEWDDDEMWEVKMEMSDIVDG
ncbi:putative carboxylesterase [Moniliophthora roreri MCA 2997]|uniref:Carboxylic ester hydrolase n=1 Tax=Moniliophthora roreri (strain MCA 2997) TaxID=1381753 RepID=V2W6N9_MONRO|nr:putative carboxylesterase [Moniliophthora roreri MCA 2997]